MMLKTRTYIVCFLIVLSLFVSSKSIHPKSIVSAQSTVDVELLDIETNETRTIEANPKIQLEAKKIIKEIDTIVIKLDPFSDKGYMLRIPLTPSLQLKNEWVNSLIGEVFIIIPEGDKPFLLIFDDKNKPYFFSFKREIDSILKMLDVPI